MSAPDATTVPQSPARPQAIPPTAIDTTPSDPSPAGTTQALTHAVADSYPGVLESAGRARRRIRALLADHPDLDTAVLLTSELIANAVEHSRSRLPGGRVTVRVLIYDDGTRVEVIDDGPLNSEPRLCDADDDAETGRGLMLVQASAPWGVENRDGHTAVWFELVGTP